MKIPNSRLICIRGFSSCMNRSKNILIVHKTLDKICEESKRHFSKHLVMTECKQLFLRKSPAARPLCYSMIASSSSCLPSFKSCPPTTYISLSVPCHHESINLKCQNMLNSPCSPPYLVVHPKPIKKSQSLKIYNKCLLSLKNLKLPSPSSFKYSKLNSLELRKNKEILTHRSPSSLISLHRVHRRGFHIISFCLADSNSDKSFGCKKIDEICQSTEVKKTDQNAQSCNEKSDGCYQKKVKCDKRQQTPKENKAKAKPKPETEQKIVDPVCKKDCLARGKCEWPHTVPPPKMEYVKVTCPPPKFTRPNPCPSTSEHFKKDDASHPEIKKTNFQKKQVCSPPPLPKPPYEPIILCPCPPPRKVHPGACPCYEMKVVPKPTLMQPCPLKKQYPCPEDIHYCLLEKNPCNLFKDSDCELKKKKKTTKTPAL